VHKIQNKNFHWQILLSLSLAITAGILTSNETVILGFKPYDLYTFIGKLFINGLKMLSIPLILTSIISGMASIGSDAMIGKMGMRTVLFYIFSSLCAITIGLVFINLIQPGYEINLKDINHHNLTEELKASFNTADASSFTQLTNIFYQMLPNNIFQAAANGQLLGLIVFSLLFGYFILHTKEKHRELLKDFWAGSLETVMLFTMWFLRFAPIGIFGLVAKSISETGFDTLLPMIHFFFTVLAALMCYCFVVLSFILYFVSKVNPWQLLKALLPALLTAFSTSSSAATLPITLECVEKNAGVSNKISSFVLPLGTTVNMNGTALYEGMAAIFIAQAYGLHIGIDKQFIVLIMALLTSIGVAGIPSASLVAITIILSAVGLPLESIGLLMITDRLLDMFRTAVNVYGDACGAVIIARNLGEKTAVGR
jgi:Na+/H+-dicarboxylate symporter